ncbi:hypothetical protein N8303_03700 [Gammaproteobacteria bacterium]|nr:hypothetical protein [Gammaproteobacteria bacterium]
MSRSKMHSYFILMLLVFAGQSIATPFMNCCMETENTKSEAHGMSSHHVMYEIEMLGHHQPEMSVNKHVHPDNDNCNHQCDACLGTVLAGEFSAFITQVASTQLNETYHFLLAVSLTDNPFRPPIFT